MIPFDAAGYNADARKIFSRSSISNSKYIPQIFPMVALRVASHRTALQFRRRRSNVPLSNQSVCYSHNERSLVSGTFSKNGKPVAKVDVVDLKKSSSTFNVLANGSDPDRDRLLITGALAHFGAVAFTSEGIIGYAQNPGEIAFGQNHLYCKRRSRRICSNYGRNYCSISRVVLCVLRMD